MGSEKWIVPEVVSEESRKWAKKNKFQLIGVICKDGREYQVIICPACKCPRFADYRCDTCTKREIEHEHKKFEEKVSKLRDFLKQI